MAGKVETFESQGVRTPLVLTGREKPGLTSWATELLGSGELGVRRLDGRWWGERKGVGHWEGRTNLGGSWLLPLLAGIQMWAPRSWVGRDLGDIKSGWSVLLRELGNLLLAWNLVYPVVACGRNVLLRCLWWVFVLFAMLGEMPIHFYGTLGSTTDLYSGLNGLDCILFPMALPERDWRGLR